MIPFFCVNLIVADDQYMGNIDANMSDCKSLYVTKTPVMKQAGRALLLSLVICHNSSVVPIHSLEMYNSIPVVKIINREFHRQRSRNLRNTLVF